MSSRIITISREFGSGGRTIGRQTAEKLGIPCYDQELIGKISEESGLAEDYIQEKGEYGLYGSRLANAFSGRDYRGLSLQDYLWTAQRKVILGLAGKGPCVIVGRCADYVLREEAECLKVFIHASMEKRAERIVRVYGESEDSPEKRLKDKDKRRKAYYQYYTNMEWGNVTNYHIALDSGVLGIERCTDLIAGLYKSI